MATISGPLKTLLRQVADLPPEVCDVVVPPTSARAFRAVQCTRSWADAKPLLLGLLPDLLPVEEEIDMGHTLLTDRRQAPGTDRASVWLEGRSVVDRLAYLANVTTNNIMYNLLRGVPLPETTTISELLQAQTAFASLLVNFERNVPLGVASRPLEDPPANITAPVLLRSFQQKTKGAVTFISRMSLAKFVGRYEGAIFITRGEQRFLELDRKEFELDKHWMVTAAAAPRLVEAWNASKGIQLELVPMDAKMERRMLFLLGNVRYVTKGQARFDAPPVPPAIADSLVYLQGLDEVAGQVAKLLHATLERGVIPPSVLQDRVCLYHHVVKANNVPMPWDDIDARLELVDGQFRDWLGLPNDQDYDGEAEELEAVSYLSRLQKILRQAVGKNALSARSLKYAVDEHGRMVPELKATHVLSCDPSSVVKRMTELRSLIRNNDAHKEKFWKGATFPGLGVGLPNGVQTGFKMAEAIERLPPGTMDKYRQVWGGIADSFHMYPLAAKDAVFYDIRPQPNPFGVEVRQGDLLTMKSEGGDITLRNSILISDIAVGDANSKSVELYRQLDNVCEAHAEAFIIKLFLVDYNLVRASFAKLVRHFGWLEMSGVTKGHACEYFLVGAHRRDAPLEVAPPEELGRVATFFALHALRADVYNQIYTSAIMAGALDVFPLLARVDDVFQDEVGGWVGAAWGREIPEASVSLFQGHERRTGTAAAEPELGELSVSLGPGGRRGGGATSSSSSGRADRGKEKVDE